MYFPQVYRTSLLLFVTADITCAQSFNALQYVNQLIGTRGGGNVFPGSTVPYGVAKAVADTDSGARQGGFSTDGANVTGFSQLHDSGTGSTPSLGLFPLFPFLGCANDDINGCRFPNRERKTQFRNESLQASPGFFGLTLNNGIRVEMTSARRTNLFKFVFPTEAITSSPAIILDLSDLSDSRQDNGTINVDGQTGRMSGNARFLPSFAQGNYIAYFCADFRGGSVRDNGIYANSRASTDVKSLTISRSINGFSLPGGAFIRFEPGSSTSITARVAVSFISEQQACANAESEIPDFDFQAVQNAAVEQWRQKLSPIVVSETGVDRLFLNTFYSGFYRTMISPQDYSGENPLWQNDEPYFDSFYCIWDLFRSQLPFLTVVDTPQLTRIIRSLIETYRNVGWLPDCRMTFSKGYTQGGSNADVVLVDAYVKGIRDGVNWQDGYAAVVKDAEVEPFDWCCQGRGGLDSWKSLGYIPVEDFDYKGFGTLTRSISRILEYSYNDFTISELASRLGGLETDVEKYRGRSGNWRNLFVANQRSALFNGSDTGFTGFLQPRYQNGTWGSQNPLVCAPIDPDPNRACSLTNNAQETYESSIWEYNFYVPHDQAALITVLGGPVEYVRRLDYYHDNGITFIGNQPSYLTLSQYHYAGRPGLSAKRSHFYIPSRFNDSIDGLPGNDDSGTMGAFVAFNMMGLIPSPGQDVYFIIPPYFESVNSTSPATNQTATIRNANFDPSYGAIYIQNATLNGEPYTKNWIDHSFFLEGKELVLTLGRNESTTWGTRIEDLPPSLSEYQDFNASQTLRREARRSVKRSVPIRQPQEMQYWPGDGRI
ncbi:putative glycosyl hydrolase family 92 protein 2 [Elsinoe fawcettii]|nr:putative glycosyl hydrolase family 92 protein 2 [Elsinoe fawcettii]